MAETRRIGEVDVVAVDRPEAIALIARAVERQDPAVFGFCNAHTVNMAARSRAFQDATRDMTLFNDGLGMDIASRVLHRQSFPQNLNGTDLTPEVLAGMPRGARVFLVGSAPGVADVAKKILADQFPQLIFVGAQHGFFAEEAEHDLNATVRAAKADLVIVGMGHPRQELWAVQNYESVSAVILCVGAFLDFTAGEFRRAPQWIRGLRLEWLFRLALEPRRLMRRYLAGNVAFLARVAQQRLAQRRR